MPQYGNPHPGIPGPHPFVVLAKRDFWVRFCNRSMFGCYYCPFCHWQFYCRPSRVPQIILPCADCPVCNARFRVVLAPEGRVTQYQCNNWSKVYKKKFKPFREEFALDERPKNDPGGSGPAPAAEEGSGSDSTSPQRTAAARETGAGDSRQVSGAQ